MRITLKFIGLPLLIILVTLGVYRMVKPSQQPAMAAPMAVQVVSAPVVQTDVVQTIRAFGSLYAPNDAVVASEVAGVVESINYTPGDSVEGGELLITLHQEASRAALAQAQAELKISELDYRRSQSLFAQNALAQQELETNEANFEAKQAMVDAAQIELNKTQIRAPFAGRLGAQRVSVGDYVTTGTPLVSLVNKQVLKARYAVPEFYLNQLQLGQSVTLTSDAYPGQRFMGEVDFIAPTVNEATRTISVEAKIDNSDERLSPGLSVLLTQNLGTAVDALVVPEEAILPAIEGYQVYRIDDNGRALSTLVEIGTRYDGQVQILTGLTPGERVVTQGYQKLRDGIPVEDPQLQAQQMDENDQDSTL